MAPWWDWPLVATFPSCSLMREITEGVGLITYGDLSIHAAYGG